MIRRGDLAACAALARLQGLAALREREALALACERAGRQFREAGDAQRELERSSARVDALFAGESLCLDRLALAANELVRCDTRVTTVGAALSKARQGEEEARSACRKASTQLEWIEQRVRKLRKKQLSKREESAVREAVGLRALGSGGL
jgi:hypothetical protein